MNVATMSLAAITNPGNNASIIAQSLEFDAVSAAIDKELALSSEGEEE